MAPNDTMPLWAAEIKSELSRLGAVLEAHLEMHKEFRRNQKNGDLKKLAVFGLSIGVGMGGGGGALLKFFLG